MIELYKVFVKTDNQNRITAINSNAFLSSLDGWQEIDSGNGDKYHHAQGNYVPMPIMDERGICRYKLVDGHPSERTKEEMDADCVESVPIPDPTERIAELESKLAAYEAAYLEGVNEA